MTINNNRLQLESRYTDDASMHRKRQNFSIACNMCNELFLPVIDTEEPQM